MKTNFYSLEQIKQAIEQATAADEGKVTFIHVIDANNEKRVVATIEGGDWHGQYVYYANECAGLFNDWNAFPCLEEEGLRTFANEKDFLEYYGNS